MQGPITWMQDARHYQHADSPPDSHEHNHKRKLPLEKFGTLVSRQIAPDPNMTWISMDYIDALLEATNTIPKLLSRIQRLWQEQNRILRKNTKPNWCYNINKFDNCGVYS